MSDYDRYLALFRGINVGRRNRVAMADLRTLFEALGLVQVRSLLASGNLIFSSATNSAGSTDSKRLKNARHIQGRIEEALRQRLKLDVLVTVLTATEVIHLIDDNPLLDIAEDHSRLLVSVLYGSEQRDLLDSLQGQDWGAERLAVGARVAYQWCPEGVLMSQLPEAIAKLYGKQVTTRNWATFTKIHALLTAPQ